MMRVDLKDLAGTDILSGAANGTTALARVVASLPPGAEESIIVLDFRHVEVATSSFLRELGLGLRDYCNRSRPELGLVVANPNAAVLEELRDMLTEKREAMVICQVDARGRLSGARVAGPLEEKQRFTLDAVLKLREADAAELFKRYERLDSIGVNGWNNRLAALAAKGILRERRSGRTKRYRPVVEDLQHGT